MAPTFNIRFDDEPSITCLLCNSTSYHPGDIANRYCARCKVFHLDRAWARQSTPGEDPSSISRNGTPPG